MLRRRLLPALFPLLLGAAAVAAAGPDDGAPEAAPQPTWRRAWVRRGAPLTKRLAAVLDASGSMRGRPIQLGRQELVTIFGLFPDDGWVRAYRFGDKTEDFGGWRRLPDGELLRDLDAWLSVGGTGSTYMGEALATALGNEHSDLSVILVTDGDASDTNEATLAAIELAQRRRRQGPAPIHVIAVWEHEPHQLEKELVEAIAKEHGGSLVTWRLEEPVAEKEPH